MPTQAELVDALVALDEVEFARVYYDAGNRRSAAYAEAADPLTATPTRAELAQWFARKHLSSDPALREVHVISGAESEPIRLLEIHEETVSPAGGNVSAYGYRSPAQGIDVRLQVALVPPRDLPRLQAGELRLPQGWSLEGETVIRRRAHDV